jgi:hypothetical membrane protein
MEITLKFIGIIAGVFAFYKVIVDVVLAKSNKRRDEYSFTKTYLSDLENESIHPLVAEKGFLALSGMILTQSEIRFLVNQASPSTLIELRRDVSSFLEFDETECKYVWKEKYKRPIWHSHGGKIYISGYYIFACIGLVPIFLDNHKYIDNTSIIIFCTALLITAFYNLIKHENIKQAYKFVAHVRT